MPEVPANLLFAFDGEWVIGIWVFRLEYDISVMEPVQKAEQ